MTVTATTVVLFGGTQLAKADPGCVNGGVYVLFARGSGEKFDDLRASKFKYVLSQLGQLGIRSAWAELGNLDGDYDIPGQLDSGEYPAVPVNDWNVVNTVNGEYGNSVRIGTDELVRHLNDRVSRCPNEAIVLGGYSQGADVVGWALERQGYGGLNAATRSHIAYVAMYGDPRFGCGLWDKLGVCSQGVTDGALGKRVPYVPGEFQQKVGSWCDLNDGVCTARIALYGGVRTHSSIYQAELILASVRTIAIRAILSLGDRGLTSLSFGFREQLRLELIQEDSYFRGHMTTDSTRIALPSGQQYIWQRGVTIPVGYGDAQRYDAEGNPLQPGNTNWNGPLNTVSLPPNTVIRPVGSNQQYLWSSGGQKLPIGDPATSACYFFSFPTSNPTGAPAVVPADWASTLPTGAQGNCSLGDGIRFTQSNTGSQQYISIRGGAFPVSYGDAQAHDGESNPFLGLSMPAGYVSNPVHAPGLPVNIVLRGAGSTEQFLWDGSLLHPIQNMGTSACLLIGFPQNGVALMPPSWMYNRAQGPPAQCSLSDGTRFTQTSYSAQQQYISLRGAVLPLGTDDAAAYDQAGNTRVIDMPLGYVETHNQALPANVILKEVGGTAQFRWDGSVIRPIGDPGTSQCLLATYPQNGVIDMPRSWMTGRAQGPTEQCSFADGIRFTQPSYSGNAQYISMRGAALPVNTSDAQWYDGNGYGGVMQVAAGYVQNPLHAPVLSPNTILRPTGDSRVYLWDGTRLHYVPDTATYNCLFGKYPQNGLANVPATWAVSLPVGANQTCS